MIVVQILAGAVLIGLAVHAATAARRLSDHEWRIEELEQDVVDLREARNKPWRRGGRP